MVGRWGMSQAIGPIAVIPSDAQGPLLPGVSEVSEATQELIDSEVRRIVDEAVPGRHAPADRAPRQARQPDRAPAGEETLDMDDAYDAAGVSASARAAASEPSAERLAPSAARPRWTPGLGRARAARAAASSSSPVARQVVAPGARGAVAEQPLGLRAGDPAGVLARQLAAPSPSSP